eukprot:TRINITY_DN1325_c0_g1_i1.p1 TRINITY_DN1325_c0_g1~~TRINITY_DN1325_c0_g1_i1.p1  ORF type:complete len:117 (-),score=18.32 TRINITY_DN1325_c0_g1_i1:78-428(-)
MIQCTAYSKAKLPEFDSFIDFISCLLDVNPLTRYSSEDALKHQFIVKDLALQKKMMNRNHPIIESSNDDERQNRIGKQFKEYRTMLNNHSYQGVVNDNESFTEITVKQHLYSSDIV